jgi:hypothetical protein
MPDDPHTPATPGGAAPGGAPPGVTPHTAGDPQCKFEWNGMEWVKVTHCPAGKSCPYPSFKPTDKALSQIAYTPCT